MILFSFRVFAVSHIKWNPNKTYNKLVYKEYIRLHFVSYKITILIISINFGSFFIV